MSGQSLRLSGGFLSLSPQTTPGAPPHYTPFHSCTVLPSVRTFGFRGRSLHGEWTLLLLGVRFVLVPGFLRVQLPLRVEGRTWEWGSDQEVSVPVVPDSTRPEGRGGRGVWEVQVQPQ